MMFPSSVDIQRIQNQQEGTLRSAWLISSMAPLATAIAYLLGGTAVQLADFFRRTMELVGLFVAWWVFRRVRRDAAGGHSLDRGQMEQQAAVILAAIMGVSAGFILLAAAYRLADPRPVGNVLIGLVVPVGGIIVNGWFWRRGSRLARQSSTPVVESQWRLCRAKAVLDVVILITLLGTWWLGDRGSSRWLDTSGALIVALFMSVTAIRIGIPALGLLRDRREA